MTLENSVRLFAGIMVLISLALYFFVTPYGLYLTAFVGFNLIQSSLTGDAGNEDLCEMFLSEDVIDEQREQDNESEISAPSADAAYCDEI